MIKLELNNKSEKLMQAKRNIWIYLQDIIEAADLIEQYVEDISEEEFVNNTEKQDAVLRRIQIIGEAAKHIPEDYWIRI